MTYPLINGAAINGSAESGPPTTQGVMSTRFGVPSLILGAGPERVLEPSSLGQLVSIGAPTVEAEVTVLTVLAQPLGHSTKFGQSLALREVMGAGLASLGVVSMGSVVRFSGVAAHPVLTVDAAGLAPGASFGTPGVGTGHTAAGFRSTSIGAVSAQRGANAAGFRSTSFGALRAARTARVSALPGLRFGTPRIAGYSYVETAGFCGTALGVPSTHSGARALPAAPSARFGRPTIVRNSTC